MSEDVSRRDLADNFARRFAPPELYDPKKRREWKLGRDDADRGPYVIELNLQHIEGLSGSRAQLEALLAELHELPVNEPRNAHHDAIVAEPISKTYVGCTFTLAEWQELLRLDAKHAIRRARAESRDDVADEALPTMRYRAIYKLWPDFPVYSHVYKSVATIKSDAAVRSFNAAGSGIVWAVIDSGIDSTHPHFSGHTLDAPDVRDLHRCFVDSESKIPGTDIPCVMPAPSSPDDLDRRDYKGDIDAFLKERLDRLEAHRKGALTDDFGHGTHVAGIIAGSAAEGHPIRLLERTEEIGGDGELHRAKFALGGTIATSALRGVAPDCRLVSLRVLDAKGEGRSSHVIRALDYILEKLNDNPKLLRVHGVNLSVGYEFDAEMFACGQSPICAEVNRLVQSGVVVVAAAGNTGFGTVAAMVRPTKVGLSNTINDPGNAELAITVGATHRDSPYTYGVSYFSSKGPTGDGRLKPDIIAPGERITSCGAGERLRQAKAAANVNDGDEDAYYMEDSGTSMAAPHVSGAVAAFLSIRREFIGKPLEVKRIFLSTASPLGRERYFEGHGLLDLIRAIQSV